MTDSTGIKVEGGWHTRKHGGSKRRVWRKIHLGIDEETLEIRAVEVTSGHVGPLGRFLSEIACRAVDAPMLPDLLARIPAEEEIARPWKPDTAGARARNEILRASKHLGRALWRNWSRHHHRSRRETKMTSVKLLGQRLMSRAFDRQVSEAQIRAAVLNRATALGIPMTVAAG